MNESQEEKLQREINLNEKLIRYHNREIEKLKGKLLTLRLRLAQKEKCDLPSCDDYIFSRECRENVINGKCPKLKDIGDMP